jgi:exodeoxyribonuclease V alpha subunit
LRAAARKTPAAGKLLEVPAEIIERALSQMLTGGFIVLEEIDGEPLVFLPHLRRAEEGIAVRIRRLASARPAYPTIDFEKAVNGARLVPARRWRQASGRR